MSRGARCFTSSVTSGSTRSRGPREGADVVGVDFSDTAIEAARDLAAEADLTGRARFLAADVYDLPERLADAHGTFDLVFTSYGVLGWLPDVEA